VKFARRFLVLTVDYEEVDLKYNHRFVLGIIEENSGAVYKNCIIEINDAELTFLISELMKVHIKRVNDTRLRDNLPGTGREEEAD
jgi:hypothetical protein